MGVDFQLIGGRLLLVIFICEQKRQEGTKDNLLDLIWFDLYKI